MLKNDKTVVISGEITPELAVQTVLKLVQLHSSLPVSEKITLFIFSIGGDCDSALSIIDTIEQIKAEGRVVRAYCTGRISSMAVYVTMSCTKGERFATNKTTFMVHDINCSVEGSSIYIKSKIVDLEITNNHINNLISNYSSKKLLEFIETNKNVFFTAKEALDLGIIDSIL